jgi:hypothetical protein
VWCSNREHAFDPACGPLPLKRAGFAEVWLKAIDVAARKMGWLVFGLMLGSIAGAQVVPPAQTVPEAPSLQNETLKPLDYRNKYDIYGGLAYSHFNSGPFLVAGTNLGGFDFQGTDWLKMRLGITANFRGYYGTQGVLPNDANIHGPLVYEHLFLGGVSARGPKNEHAALTFHGLIGGSYGVFNADVPATVNPQQVLGLFSNGMALAMVAGGSLDLNRSSKLSLRLSPDYVVTRFGGQSQNEFAISVGILYRLSKMRK